MAGRRKQLGTEVSTKSLGKRERVICGKVSQNLYESARQLIDGNEFKTMNDVVEIAVWHLITDRTIEGIGGGASLGN